MDINGKCLDAFNEWFYSFFGDKVRWASGVSLFLENGDCFRFKDLPYSMKYGVYVDFFLANEIIVDVQPILDYDEDVYTKVLYYLPNVTKLNFDPSFLDNTIETENIQEARTEAIKRANEIFNNG